MNQTLTRSVLGLFVALALLAQPANAVELGEASPQISFTDAAGKRFSLDSLRGQVVYLDIWASWCSTCANSLTWLNELQQKYGKDQFKVVAINVDENREDADKLLKTISAQMLLAFDPKGEVPGKFNIQAMPTSLLIDRNGKIVSIHQGLKDTDRLAIEKMIQNEVNSLKAA